MNIQRLSALSSLLLASVTVPALSAATTYTFSGACVDCTGSVTATLILEGYTQGTAITNIHFVSFSYGGSNLLAPYVISNALENFETISGLIPVGLPAPAAVFVLGVPFFFESFANGTWETGSSIVNDDFGNTGVWNGNITGVPEPSTVLLLGSAGLAMLGLRRWRRA